MWDIKLKATNTQTRKTKKKAYRHRQQYGGYQREEGGQGSKGGQIYGDKVI